MAWLERKKGREYVWKDYAETKRDAYEGAKWYAGGRKPRGGRLEVQTDYDHPIYDPSASASKIINHPRGPYKYGYSYPLPKDKRSLQERFRPW